VPVPVKVPVNVYDTTWHYKDSTRWTTLDSTRWNTLDSTRWNITDKDSVRIHYSDSCVGDTTSQIPVKNIFGILPAMLTPIDAESLMQRDGLNLIRKEIYFSVNTVSKIIDQYLTDGYNVQINFQLQTYRYSCCLSYGYHHDKSKS
jgi:hypothetical protein